MPTLHYARILGFSISGLSSFGPELQTRVHRRTNTRPIHDPSSGSASSSRYSHCSSSSSQTTTVHIQKFCTLLPQNLAPTFPLLHKSIQILQIYTLPLSNHGTNLLPKLRSPQTQLSQIATHDALDLHSKASKVADC